jgi:5-methyltetrahydrofolate--homocysteine methyltransferase
MAIEGLRIIGESINESVPSTRRLYEAGDTDALVELARTQAEKGASYVDVNIGTREPAFMADIVRRIQGAISKPLSIDTPDPEIAAAGLQAYDPQKAGGSPPILNSISPLRLQMLQLYKIQPFRPILMVSERVEDGASKPNRTPEETHGTAREMLETVKKSGHEIAVQDCIFDVGIAPVGSDTEGLTRTTLESIRRIHEDASLAGAHMSLGLSNFTVMLPSKRPDGSPVKGALESAFLTMTVPLGLDMVIGSVKRDYRLLPEEHPAMKCLQDVLTLNGYDIIMRVQEFYTS